MMPAGSCETAIACSLKRIAFEAAETLRMSLPMMSGDAEIAQIAEKAGLHVIEDAPVPGSIDTRWQTARLVVLGQGSKG